MRERIFKAKRKNWKEIPKEQWWVEGAIFKGKENSYIITNVKITDEWEESEIGADVIGYLVEPETICQCTGHKDDTGKRIFEGDIVSFTDGTSTESGFLETCCCGKVGYDEEEACFYVSNRLSAESWEVLDGCHIIGNIFDNPELLE